MLEFSATIDQMEALFSTAHLLAVDPETKEARLQHEEYTIPQNLQEHIEFATISAVDNSKTDLRKRQSSGGKTGGIPAYKAPEPQHTGNCSESWTPACIRGEYL